MTQSQLRAILEGIAGDQTLTPEAVVEAAGEDGHPLHGQFEWDDRKAAHAHRVEAARALIRSVSYRARVIHGSKVTVPIYVHSPRAEEGEAGYVALDSIARASEDAAAVLRDEMARIIGAARRALAVASRVGDAGMEARLADLLSEAQQAEAAITARTAAA